MAAFVLNDLTRGQRRALSDLEDTRKSMWDARLDGAHQQVIAEAGGFIYGATGHRFNNEKTLKTVMAAARYDSADIFKEYESDEFKEW